MATKKSSQQEDLLTHHIQAKVTAKVYQRLEDLRIKNKLLNDKRTRQANTLKKKNCLLLSRPDEILLTNVKGITKLYGKARGVLPLYIFQ